VPSASKTPVERPKQPGILLIEEYDALAIAICSALKSFAPQRATQVARNLAEAEKVAAKTEPDLFVIDFDPAFPGLTEFLEKMRDVHPDAKVLIIAPGVSSELAAERRSFGALQFVEKPFEVADFGAAVQALLGPWKESESAHSRGTLRSLSVADIILLQCGGGRSVTIEAKASDKQTGQVHVQNGHLSHAETSNCTGVEALEEILAWPEVRVREVQKTVSRRRTIKGPWEAVFLEACRQAQAQLPPRIVAPKEVAPAKRHPKAGKKIVVIDDTEMLLIFVEDVLATADPDLQITTALNGTSGIKAIERVMPDLVLLDYSLPDINGDEVCRRLLETEQTARIPILMMSGHVAEMSQTAARFDNVVATIEKPFLSEALVALVQQTLREPRPPRKIAEMPRPAEPAKPAPVSKPVEADKPAKSVKPPESPPLPVAPPQPKSAGSPRLPNGGHVSTKPRTAPTPPGAPESISKLALARAQAATAAPREPVRVPKTTTISAPVSTGPKDVILGIFLEVISLQLTAALRIGMIRAKPSYFAVSLHVASPAFRGALPETGFQLGPVELDTNGRIATMHLVPTLQPFRPLEMQNAFQIGGVSVVPANSRERVQLTSTESAPMTMRLLSHLEIAGVELSTTFQIGQLILRSHGNIVRVTLSLQAAGQDKNGATYEIVSVRLDNSARITELVLIPVR
jgi:DNA-binding response OmpR family regulator